MINLDNNATTAIDPTVLEAMVEAYSTGLGNPASLHRLGQKAKAHLADAYKKVAAYFGVKSSELVFTSSATEALNMVLKGVFSPHFKGHLITSSLEHIAVYETALWLQERGVEVSFLDPLEGEGAITLEQVKRAVKPTTKLISLMAVNNETGIKTDIATLSMWAKEVKIPLLVDGVALLGKEPVQVHDGISAMCFSGHKIHGPSGVGLAFVRKGFKLNPLVLGGKQHHGMRGGTENLSGIIGFAKAVALLENIFPEATIRMRENRDHLEKGLMEALPNVLCHSYEPRVCNTTNLSFVDVEGESLLMHLDLAKVAVSHGAACSSGSIEPSRVLLQMGVNKEIARSAIRFSLSRNTTREEIDQAIEIIVGVVKAIRKGV